MRATTARSPRSLCPLLAGAVLLAACHVASMKVEAPCHELAFTYFPSDMEMNTSARAEAWQTSYCSLYMTDTPARSDLMQSIAAVNGQQTSRLIPTVSIPPGLSYFQHVFVCGGQSHTITTVIEPLYASMRHPEAVSCSDAQTLIPITGATPALMSTDHIVMADGTTPMVRHARHKFYFDLGASLWPELSQRWMISQYKERGIIFDRILLWEAKPRTGPQILEDVPPEMYHAYQYFNEPLTADPASPKNPLNILREIAQPHDFVALKLDIDHTPYEISLVKQILDDPELSSRIDEFYWEPHFSFPPLTDCCWRNYKEKMDLAETWGYLHRLRLRGIRTHGWP